MRPPTVGANPADAAAPTLIRWRETDDQRQRAIGRPIAGLPCGAERQQPCSQPQRCLISDQQAAEDAGRITAKIASVRLRRFNLCADYFRSTPINRRSQCRPACLKGARRNCDRFQRQENWDSFGMSLGHLHETSPSFICAAGRRCCRVASRVAARMGANLSRASSAHHRWLYTCWRERHRCAPDRSMAVGAARPTICC